MRRDLAVCLFLVVATLAVYGQTLRHDFINYDDDKYVYQNPHVREGLTPESIGWALTAVWSSNWHPLTWLSHMLDCELFGLDAGYHHLVNVLLHILNSLLLYMVLKGMTGAVWRSAICPGPRAVSESAPRVTVGFSVDAGSTTTFILRRSSAAANASSNSSSGYRCVTIPARST